MHSTERSHYPDIHLRDRSAPNPYQYELLIFVALILVQKREFLWKKNVYCQNYEMWKVKIDWKLSVSYVFLPVITLRILIHSEKVMHFTPHILTFFRCASIQRGFRMMLDIPRAICFWPRYWSTIPPVPFYLHFL